MPETRYIESYEAETGKLIARTPYQVSDEELALEKKARRLDSILDEIDELKAELADVAARLKHGCQIDQ